MNSFKKLLAIFGLTLVMAAPVGGTAFAAVDPLKNACDQLGPSRANNNQTCDNETRESGTNPLTGNQGVITSITNIVALIAGTAAVVVIIVAGLQYVVANGDSTKITNARNAIIYAVIGLIVIIVARGIILFVLGKI